MRSEAFVWGTRLKSVEREYVTVRLAMDRLDQHTRDDPTVLQYDLRFRHIGAASTRLEGTYLLRLFAEFEIALRHFLKASHIRAPRNAEPLINKIKDRAHIANDDALKAHAVRAYRNTLIHDDAQPAPSVSIRDATHDLGTFIAWLQRYW
jgi:hypothetical protein